MKKAVVFLLCLCLSAVVLTAGAGANAEDCGIALFIDGEAFAPPAPMIVKRHHLRSHSGILLGNG